MCGLAGILPSIRQQNAIHSEVLRAALHRMNSTLIHRGPDAGGLYVKREIGLGHRRLSILDISEAGAQPMELRPDGPVIAYNGECYNFRELRDELTGLGRLFKGHSDTEVILNAYDAWGLDGLRRLEGIFAIALWDPSCERLVLMRDRLGVKPLYYGDCQFGLAFGSEMKALLAAGGVNTRLNDQAFAEYLWYGNSHEDRTFYQGIRILLPGHWMIIEHGEKKIQAWWKIEEWLENSSQSHLSLKDAAEKVEVAIDSAVSRQLVADVPVGIFLSGGVDSAAIAASASRSQLNAVASYAAGFDFDQGVNELPKARGVAELLGLNHHELSIHGDALESVLLVLAQSHDEPFADAANIPLYLMCREVCGTIKVVLQGDGGDELFGGYRRYSLLSNSAWWRLLPRSLGTSFRRFGGFGNRLARLMETVGERDASMRMAMLLTVETMHQRPECILLEERREHLSKHTDPFLAYKNAAIRFANFDPTNQMLLTDLTVQLPSQFLIKVDRATMSTGVEARVPLLDEQVAGLAVGLPPGLKVRRLQKKIVLRKSQRNRLPSSVLDGPKTGFGVPYGHWLRRSLYEFARERLLDKAFLSEFSINAMALENTLEAHHQNMEDRGFLLWKLLQLALWKETRPAQLSNYN